MLTEERQLMMWAASVFAAVYLVLVFVAGAWVEPRPWAWKLATLSAGLAYLCTLAKSYEARAPEGFHPGLARLTFWSSLAAGAGAGVLLV